MSYYEEHFICWQGIDVTIRHCKSWLCDDCSVQHIELHSRDREPLPITETGYKSHFICGADALTDYGNDPVAYVTAWLDHEATVSGWTGQRQLCLF